VRGLGAARLEWSAPPAVSGAPWGTAERAVLRVHPGDLRAALALGAPPLRKVAALLPWLGGARARAGGAAAGSSRRRRRRRSWCSSSAEWRGRCWGSMDRRGTPARPGGRGAHGGAGRSCPLGHPRSCGTSPCVAMAEADRTLGAGWATLVTRAEGLGDRRGAARARSRARRGWRRSCGRRASGRVLIVGGGGGAYAPLQALHQAAMVAGGPVLQIRGLGREEDAVVIGLGQPPWIRGRCRRRSGRCWRPAGRWRGWSAGSWRTGRRSWGRCRGPATRRSNSRPWIAGEPAAVLWFPPRLRAAYVPHDPCPTLVRIAAIGVGAGCGLRDELAALIEEGASKIGRKRFRRGARAGRAVRGAGRPASAARGARRGLAARRGDRADRAWVRGAARRGPCVRSSGSGRRTRGGRG
jgi:hypothetical protein